MPSHPDRVRRNYEDKKENAIYFRGMKIHSCDKIPPDADIMYLHPDMTHCPYCLEKIK